MALAAGLMWADAGARRVFHPGHKILPHLPHVLKKRLRKTPLLKPFVAPDAGESGLRIVPTRFGGDPTGLTDSTDSLLKAVEYCVNVSKTTDGKFPDGAGDAHGCTIDLDGGEYLISRTLVIPTYVSNMRIQTGSLVANPKSSTWQVEPESPSKPACSFPQNQTNRWCQAMHAGPSPESDVSAEACESYCCKTPGCLVWQFCPAHAPCAESLVHSERCWFNPAGYDPAQHCEPSSSTQPSSVGWVGGSSKTPFTPGPGKPPYFMIQVGGTETCVSYHQGSCNEDIGFPGLFLDGSHVASGIQINSVMGTTVGEANVLLKSYIVLIGGAPDVHPQFHKGRYRGEWRT